MINPADLTDLLGRWWWNYDEGHFDVLDGLLTDDVHFTCRTDTGTTDWEEFVRADITGRETVMLWQREHRVSSPYPLRHHLANAHIVEQRGVDATFASYIFVTQMMNGQPSPLPCGIVNGAVCVVEGVLKIAELAVILDTMDSVVFSTVRA
jgi:SnoaL-like domain